MGPQGSGKTTQAQLLAQRLGLPHLQTGELYRQIAEEDSPRGRRIKSILDQGQLISDEDHNRILEKEIKKRKYQKGFVLDGSPRTISQAKTQPFETDRVFYLRVSDKENIKRLIKRGRVDDTPQLIKERLRIYHQETEPVLNYYRQLGILTEINGERPIEEIHRDIANRLRV